MLGQSQWARVILHHPTTMISVGQHGSSVHPPNALKHMSSAHTKALITRHTLRHSKTASSTCVRPRAQGSNWALSQLPQQEPLTAANMPQFVARNQKLLELLGDVQAGLQVQELLDGVINTVYLVTGSTGRQAVIKQALPYVRAVGESFPLSRERMDVEAAAMQLLHACCPSHIPQLYVYDQQQSILAMQCIPPPHKKLLYCIQQGQILPNLATQLAELLAAYLSHTNLARLTQEQRAATIARFANTDIVEANERVVLQSCFTPGDSSNRWSSPQLDADVQQLWSNEACMASAAAMLQVYRQQKEALIHNDLHAGNLLTAAPGSVYLIDWEFATTGPIAFDLGCLVGNICLAVLSLQGMHAVEEKHANQQQQRQQLQRQQQEQQQFSRREQAEWLLQLLGDVWRRFLQLYPADLKATTTPSQAAVGGSGGGTAMQQDGHMQQQQWEQQLLADACGFAGCCLIRLTIGLHHYPSIELIQDDSIRVPVERACLQLGQQLLLLRAAHIADSCRGGNSRSMPHSSGSSRAKQPGDMTDADAAACDGGVSIQLVQQLLRDACGAWLA